jgi:hypothetical protein
MTYQFTIMVVINNTTYTSTWDAIGENRQDALDKLIRNLKSTKGIEEFEVIG